MWSAAPTAALIENDDSVPFGIEKASDGSIGTRAWSAVQEHNGLALGITALLEIQFMRRSYRQKIAAVGCYRRIQRATLTGLLHINNHPCGILRQLFQ
jgi:hypothetical protein